MDRASFELIGNVGKLEIKPIKGDKKLAIISSPRPSAGKPRRRLEREDLLASRRRLRAREGRLIEKAVQVGTRLRLVGQIRPAPGKMSAARPATRSSSS
jgi:hypothetical protein